MSTLALGLILVSAVTHATWNLFAKRAATGLLFTFLIAVVAALFYAPITLGVLIWQQDTIHVIDLGFLGVSTLLQLLYFFLLNRGYHIGDLSLVYPLARGSGPLFAVTASILFLGERPSSVALFGVGLIAVGVLVLTGGMRILRGDGGKNQRTAVIYALLLGVTIASYTVWDKVAVSRRGISPLLVNWSVNVGLLLVLLPYALRQWAAVRATWQQYWREALVVGILNPFAYLLVLIAMIFTPVSYVAPAREISILVGVFMGSRVLAEGDFQRRLIGASIMTLGVVALALG